MIYLNSLKKFLLKIIPHSFVCYVWHLPNAFLASCIYGFPARKLSVIGIVGTKGKTTTSHITAQLLELAGYKTALLSTAVFITGENETLNNLKITTPSSWYIQKFLRCAVRNGCSYAVIEVSSHAIKQFRLFGIRFAVLGITNLNPDHLEYHKTAEDYIKTHKNILNKTNKIVINKDDKNTIDLFPDTHNATTYGLSDQSDIFAKQLSYTIKGVSGEIKIGEKFFVFSSNSVGECNLYNLLCSVAVVYNIGVDGGVIINSLSKIKNTPGRFEVFYCDNGVTVIVDYAHSQDSLKNFFEAIRPIVKKELLCVFGACGERDPSQRPIMGEIIDFNSDVVIITTDDPYSEDPKIISHGVLCGVLKNNSRCYEKDIFDIPDRKQAIEKVLSLAKEGDVVVILGKGAEQWQVFKDKKIPWDDREIVKEILKNYAQKTS